MNNQIDEQMIKGMTDDQLKVILERIQEELDERKWKAILAKPQSIKKMEELAQNAIKEHVEGKTVKGGFGRE